MQLNRPYTHVADDKLVRDFILTEGMEAPDGHTERVRQNHLRLMGEEIERRGLPIPDPDDDTAERKRCGDCNALVDDRGFNADYGRACRFCAPK